VFVEHVLQVDDGLRFIAQLEVRETLFEQGGGRLVRGPEGVEQLGEGVDCLLELTLRVVTLTDPVQRIVGEVGGRIALDVVAEPLDCEVEVPAQVVS
jgi:hypothetical protein